MLEATLRPLCTLYHWDLPQALQDKGGWADRDTAARLADFAEMTAKQFGDRVKVWAILNEPLVFTTGGYRFGGHAPGIRDFSTFLRTTHVVNLAQGAAFRAIKSVRKDLDVGTAFSMHPAEPASNSPEDKDACERYFNFGGLWFTDPPLRGRYPKVFPNWDPLPAMGFQSGDEERMRAAYDWIGLNYYTRYIVRATTPTATGEGAFGFEARTGTEGPLTDFGWEVWPRGIYDLVMRISREYDHPLIEITENGAGYDDPPDASGRIPDQRRIDFLDGHVRALHRAIQDGARIRGYHHWSAMDNFEWAEGMSARFGLTWIDYRDQRRIVKDSGLWYERLARENAIPPLYS
jgi:beta-glucosidase